MWAMMQKLRITAWSVRPGWGMGGCSRRTRSDRPSGSTCALADPCRRLWLHAGADAEASRRPGPHLGRAFDAPQSFRADPSTSPARAERRQRAGAAPRASRERQQPADTATTRTQCRLYLRARRLAERLRAVFHDLGG